MLKDLTKGNEAKTIIAQNKGANKLDRVQRGIISAVIIITVFCAIISALVVIFARPLLGIFIKAEELEVIRIGVQYLRIVGIFYCLIGYLFMFYGLYRGFGKVGISIILTVISLGSRVVLAYSLAPVPAIGLVGIWWAIPIGWALADITGTLFLRKIQMGEA